MTETTSERFYVVAYQYDEKDTHEDSEEVWTISTDPKIPGWNTDGGYDGYGLTKPMAEFLVNAANKELERLRNG